MPELGSSIGGVKRKPAPQARGLVIGAGVSGLTSALCLRRNGLEVATLADKFAPQVIPHGGAGVTFLWGCVIQVAKMVQRIL
jgi:ribulose 1,5-bisphosphate synthetase/thiazole synthase